jgi:hypothetical protein
VGIKTTFLPEQVLLVKTGNNFAAPEKYEAKNSFFI